MKNKNLLIVLGVVAVVLCVMLLVRLLSGEDNWICQNGQWVKHGNPSQVMPQEKCK